MNEMQSRPAESWKFTPANTAVVVVDMQNIWVHPRGARYLPASEDIVPRIQELLRYCHRKILHRLEWRVARAGGGIEG